ncbi:MAG: lepB [Chlamydiales bacterium]|jgi:signal peptidase I|nr:lepB [Chlamydiales bacterium]
MYRSTPKISLNRAKAFFYQLLFSYKQRFQEIPSHIREAIDPLCLELDASIEAKDKPNTSILVEELEKLTAPYLKPTLSSYAKEFFITILVALSLTIVVRCMWFEPYYVPTGSMRPTLKEGDRPLVSKTSFGLNIPFTTGHFYFNPEQVSRTGIFIFTVENLPISDPDTTYFYFFNGKKRYIKRCMAKPGDTIYFYGGKIYGIDQDGRDLMELRDSSYISHIDHVPMGYFGFDYEPSSESTGVMKHFGIPIATVTTNQTSNRSQYTLDKLQVHTDSLWGIENYAMARLLTKRQLKTLPPSLTRHLEEGELYLELRYLGKPEYQEAHIVETTDKKMALLQSEVVILPLHADHINAIADNIYTCRFFIKNGLACPYDYDNRLLKAMPTELRPSFPDAPDGCYEYYYGQCYEIGWGGTTKLLSADHPLQKRSSGLIQQLFNLGINMSLAYQPGQARSFFPPRYAYFRDGDLYLLGAPVVKKEDPILIEFVKKEQKKGELLDEYKPFLDRGAPIKEGQVDIDFIKKHGLKIPPKQYLALGDNHAMSGDSRIFGLVPEENLQGSPAFLMWPPGQRWGLPKQPLTPYLTATSFLMWVLCAGGFATYLWYRRREKRQILEWIRQRVEAADTEF